MNRQRPRRGDSRSRRGTPPPLDIVPARLDRHVDYPQCAKCQKVSYPSEVQAEWALMETRLQRALRPGSAGKRREERAYPCPWSGGAVWHLTSRPRRDDVA